MEKLTFKEFLAKYWLISFVYGFLIMLLGPTIFSILGAIINSGEGRGVFEIFWSLFSIQIYFYPFYYCLLYTSPSPRDVEESRMPSSA